MSLNDIVNITISTQTTAPTQAGFGTPLILSYHTVFPELVREYTSTTDMVSDGFVAGSETIRAATAVFSQSPRVTSLLVGRQATAVAQTVLCTVATVENSKLYTVQINSTEFTFTSDATATNLEIADGLVTAINLGSEPVTATDNVDGTFDLVADVTGTFFGLVMDHHYLTQYDETTASSIQTDLAAINLENSTWYCLLLTNNSRVDIALGAAWVEANDKIMVASTADSFALGTGTTTNIAYDLNNASYARTALIYSDASSWQYAGSAWAGVMLPKQPGQATWKFKTLAGVAADVLTATEQTNLESRDANHFTTVAGVNITQQGTSSSGEFMDITRFSDALKARMQENVYSVFVNTDKVPFTDPGIALIDNQMREAMTWGTNIGGLAADPAYEVRVPLAADVAFNDKAARRLVDCYAQGTLAGAIHSTIIGVTLTV